MRDTWEIYRHRGLVYLPRTGPYLVWAQTNLPVSGIKTNKQTTEEREGGRVRESEGERREREGGREGKRKTQSTGHSCLYCIKLTQTPLEGHSY